MANKRLVSGNDSQPVVLIEDDPNTLEILRLIMLGNSVEFVAFSTGAEAIKYLDDDGSAAALLIDIGLPDMSGIELMRQVRQTRKSTPCLILTARDDAQSAVQALKAGAVDYLTKPVDAGVLVGKLRAAVIKNREALVSHEGMSIKLNRWKSSRMRFAVDGALHAARSPYPVVIRGDLGTGKGDIARLIHNRSTPPRASFQKLNLAGMSDADAHLRLFGHPYESHVGSQPGVRGKLHTGAGSTLYIEHVETLGAGSQASLADWLENASRPDLPASTPRLIFSISADIDKLVESGKFRKDLWLLLSVHQIHVPSLCERVEDVPLICEDVLTEICIKGGLRRPSMTREAIELVQKHSWPNNLMELRHALGYAVTHTSDGLITPADFPVLADVRESGGRGKVGLLGRASIDEVKKASLMAALQACGGNRRKAAERLQVCLRTVHNMIRKYGLS